MAESSNEKVPCLNVFAALIINAIISGIFRSQGLLYVEFINFYCADRKRASLPFSVRLAVRNLLAPVVSILGKKYGTSTVVAVGGIIGSLSSALCIFASDIVWMTIIWGVINGFSCALIAVLPEIAIPHNVTKLKNTTIGLSYAGICLSALILPALLEVLIYNYGLNGSFLILAGLIMQTLPAGMLLEKPPWINDTPYLCSNSENEQNNCNKTEEISVLPKNENPLSSRKMCECGVQVENGIDQEINDDLAHEEDCKKPKISMKRSQSYGGLTQQMHIHNLHCANLLPTISSRDISNRLFTSNPEQIFDVDMDYLKRQSDLVFHMLSMEIPNVEVSYRAILLEIEQDELWHPDQEEIMQEVENLYLHIEKYCEIEQISNKAIKQNGLYMKNTLLNGALAINKKSESLRIVKRYLKTYKERGLQQLGKIRSAPNMSNIYNEIAKKDYVLCKLKQLCITNDIRIISLLCQYNPKDVLKVLFQIRTLYNIYSDIESCEQCDSNDFSQKDVEEEDLTNDRKDSCIEMKIISPKPANLNENTYKTPLKTAINLHRKNIFLLICFTRVVFCIGFYTMVITIVDFAMDRHQPQDDGKFIIGILSVGDMLGRLCFGWMTDIGFASLPRFILLGMFFQGLSSIIIPFMYSKWTTLLSVAVYGFIQGSLFDCQSVYVAKYLKPEEQPIASSCMGCFSGLLCLCFPYYIGYFRDILGSYNYIYFINGVILIISGFLWLLVPDNVDSSDKKHES